MLTQRKLRFELPPTVKLNVREHVFQTRVLNGKETSRNHESAQAAAAAALKRGADILKRIARRVMADMTECPPDTLPAHLARLDDIRDIMRHNVCYI